MTTYVSGTNYAKIIDPSSANIIPQGEYNGRVRRQYDTYTLASTASGVVIRCGKLPVGAKVIAVLLSNAALGSGVTLAVGNGGSGQGAIFSAAASGAAASSAPRVCQLVGGKNYTVGTLTGDDVITVTTGGATGSGIISVETLYCVD